jgi:hypothetical protein
MQRNSAIGFVRLPNQDTETVQYDADGPSFTHPEARCLQIEYPQELARLPFLGRTLPRLRMNVNTSRALLWLTGWGVWNYLDEGIGYRIVEAIHSAAVNRSHLKPVSAIISGETQSTTPTHAFWLGRELRSTLVLRAGPVFSPPEPRFIRNHRDSNERVL